jgi:Holliday junction DNA helicase RuvA
MIAGLHGRLELLGSGWAIIDVGGMGFQVYMPTSTLSTLGALGDEVKLHTYLYRRQDNATLYGFATGEELRLFQMLIGVRRLGPKLALTMLSAMNVEQLSMAIATSNTDLLTAIPGVGKKMANRLILELKGKIGAGLIVSSAQMAQEDSDVLAALTSLGYSVAEASRAIASLPISSDLSLEEKIKLALQHSSTR